MMYWWQYSSDVLMTLQMQQTMLGMQVNYVSASRIYNIMNISA